MSVPVPKGSGIIEVTLELDEGFPRCFNGGVGSCPLTLPPVLGRILSEAQWRQIFEAFDAEEGCSAQGAAYVLLLLPTFGLSFIFIMVHQRRKASRINGRLQRIAGDQLRQNGGAIGFEMGQDTANETVRPRLWIKPPKISV